MYAQVIVLTYQAPDIDSFTYEVPKELEREIKVGQLVEVPFGKRSPMGVVIHVETRDTGHVTREIKTVKPISKIIFDRPLLLPYQIDLIKWMASYYLAPMVNCLEAALPPLNVKRLMSSADKNSSVSRSTLVISQSLILVPAINRIPETLAKFPKAKKYVIFHSELKTSEKFSAWTKIISGEADYIFGSRQAIFAPCPNLKEIIIYDEHDGAYKDNRSPYFDILTVAQKVTQLTNAQIKIADPSPKITTYFQMKKHIKIQTFPQKTQIVDMQNEKISGSKSPISFSLEEEINDVLDRNGKILLFLNKKKESGQVFCRTCKTSSRLEKQPTACPNCNSPDIFWNILNVNSLHAEAKKLFPSTNVALFSEGSSPSMVVDKRSIDIGTAFSLYSMHLEKYDLVAHISADSLLNLADYTSGEKFMAQVTQLKKLLTPGAKLFLQTFSPDHHSITAAQKGDYRLFYSEELKERKSLSYPPYSLIVKLTFRDKSEDKVKKDAQYFYEKLLSTINHKPRPAGAAEDRKLRLLTVLGPYKSVFWQKIPTYHIILKHKIKDYSIAEREKSVSLLSKYLEKDRKKYTIEIEPEGIQ